MTDQDRHLREEPVNRRTVFDGRLLQLFSDTVRLPDGAESTREVIVHPGAVAIVPIDAQDRVVLVRQWRHAVGRALWEIPAGTREPGEPPADTARRELAEETGFSAAVWRELAHGPVSPGYSSETIWFFEATGLTAGASSPAEDELLDVGTFTRDQLADLATRGEVDLKTLAGLAVAGITLRTAHG